jgi:hypothetical protein
MVVTPGNTPSSTRTWAKVSSIWKQYAIDCSLQVFTWSKKSIWVDSGITIELKSVTVLLFVQTVGRP